MMDQIETYLQQGQAVADVAMLLRAPAIMDFAVVANQSPANVQINGLVPWWHIDHYGAWRRVRLDRCEYQHDGHVAPVLVYYRADGVAAMQGSYFLTDIGEAVRKTWLCDGEPTHIQGQPICDGFDFAWAGSALTLRGVAAADLPRAVCALMLAAYRVARLEVA